MGEEPPQTRGLKEEGQMRCLENCEYKCSTDKQRRYHCNELGYNQDQKKGRGD